MIKKGEKYICTDDVYMAGEVYEPIYKKGRVYQSDVDDSLIDECNDTHYWLDRELFEKHFKKCTLPIENSSDDRVNHPSHYTWLKKLCGIEVIDITRHMNFNLGQILKYILRLGHKNDNNFSNYEKILSDLHKAEYYLRREINRIDKLCKNNGNH